MSKYFNRFISSRSRMFNFQFFFIIIALFKFIGFEREVHTRRPFLRFLIDFKKIKHFFKLKHLLPSEALASVTSKLVHFDSIPSISSLWSFRGSSRLPVSLLRFILVANPACLSTHTPHGPIAFSFRPSSEHSPCLFAMLIDSHQLQTLKSDAFNG